MPWKQQYKAGFHSASVLGKMDQNLKLFRTRVKIGNWNQERYLEEVCFKVNALIHVSYIITTIHAIVF